MLNSITWLKSKVKTNYDKCTKNILSDWLVEYMDTHSTWSHKYVSQAVTTWVIKIDNAWLKNNETCAIKNAQYQKKLKEQEIAGKANFKDFNENDRY